ncbi:MAG: hypothetical protein VX104_03380 [Planctomycetota bacterium]|nr:hypothetical protein [Planctomycetota bacterium]
MKIRCGLLLILLAVGACSNEVPEAAVVSLEGGGLEAVVQPGMPQVGDFFVVQLPEEAKGWSVLVPEGVEQAILDNGDLRLRTFTAGGLILAFEGRSEQLKVVVGTSLPEDDRPDAIEGVVGLPPTIQEQFVEFVSRTWIALAALLVLLVAWIFWRSWRQRLGLGTGPQASPADRARAAVNELASELPENEVDAIAFLSELSDVIRTYLEEALQSPASRSTTPEYLADALPFLPVASRDPLEQLLRASDRAKFARSAMPAYARGVLEHARKIIDLTEPTSESEGSA